jgi:CelD/BcsL family acetyltransferase involved in cellulose biosynthesis
VPVLSVTLVRSPSPVIEDTWRVLEASSNASFFVSACWILAWLRAAQPDAVCAIVSRGSTPVAAALFAQRPGPLFGLLGSTYRLHETGDPHLDALFIEYNSILSDAAVAADAWAAILQALRAASVGSWRSITNRRSITISGATPDFADVVARSGDAVIFRREKSPFVDLRRMTKNGLAYLDALSANTRQQLRRARRGLEAIGQLRIEHARSENEALAFLSELKPLHIARWRGKGRRSGFDNPIFEPMLRQLIALGLEAELVDVLRLSAGELRFGYLVNFKYRGSVLNYTSGFAYDEAEKALKPGLVSHLLAIEEARAQGADSYKFLAGVSQYKESLSTDCEELVWLRASL